MTSRPTSADVPAASALKGDFGTCHLIGRHPRTVVEVSLATVATLLDMDTSEALDACHARPAE